MAETIYTIPVNEAFETDCECPICLLRKRFESETIDYYAGPSLMEPDTRIITNDVGFCGRHFELLYNSQAKKLGLGLMLDTYMQEQIKRLKKYAGSAAADTESNEPAKKGLFGKKTASPGCASGLVKYIRKHECECAVCSKLDYTMNRYIDIIFHLYSGEKEFREKFRACKGFCLPHLALLLETAEKKLSGSKRDDFINTAVAIELKNLERIEGEVDWFTKKFDYRNQDADWGNSRDALPRGILKMSGAKDIIK